MRIPIYTRWVLKQRYISQVKHINTVKYVFLHSPDNHSSQNYSKYHNKQCYNVNEINEMINAISFKTKLSQTELKVNLTPPLKQ